MTTRTIGRPPTPIRDRWLLKVPDRPEGQCWIWAGAKNGNGYGLIYDHTLGRHALAHRVAYILFIGPIPLGLTIDHVKARGCTSRSCVNPAHLEAVTQSQNWFRVYGGKCKNGHPMDDVYTSRTTGKRQCRPCQLTKGRERRRARNEKLERLSVLDAQIALVSP